MKTISQIVSPPSPANQWPQTGDYPVVFFDIETTGFDRQYAYVMLIGVLALKDGLWQRHQWFAESQVDEKALLKSFLEYLPKPSCLVSFNGSGFDLPFLAARMFHLKLFETVHKASEALSSDRLHVDLLKVAKHLPHRLESYRLKSIERFLGIHRKDQIDGLESVKRYRNYLLDQSEADLKAILGHNSDDIDNMIPLWRLFEALGPDSEGLKLRVTPEGALYRYTHDTQLAIEAIVSKSALRYWDHQGCTFSQDGHRLTINLPLISFSHGLNHFMVVDIQRLPQALNQLPHGAWIIKSNASHHQENIQGIINALCAF